MLYKDTSVSAHPALIKDVDSKTGTITGYFAIFGNVDSDGDMIMPGAFKRSLSNNYRRMKHLNQHRSGEVLAGTGRGNLVIKEDSIGLYFESKINTATDFGKNAFALYERGDLDEHSIGYEVVKARDSDTQTVQRYGRSMPVKELQELRLYEGSLVTWGANERARGGMKSMDKTELQEHNEALLKALKSGDMTAEEAHEALELHFKQLEQHIEDLSTPPAKAPDPRKALDLNAVLVAIHS